MSRTEPQQACSSTPALHGRRFVGAAGKTIPAALAWALLVAWVVLVAAAGSYGMALAGSIAEAQGGSVGQAGGSFVGEGQGGAQGEPVGQARDAPVGLVQREAVGQVQGAGDDGVAAVFAAECAARAAEAEKSGALAVAGKDGWLFLTGELRHLGAGRFWGEAAARVSRAADAALADPLPVILDVKRQLEAAGVELLLVPVPAKAAVYPGMLSDRVAAAMAAAREGETSAVSSSAGATVSAPPGAATGGGVFCAAGAPASALLRVDAADRKFYEVLRAEGVQVLDLVPVFLAERQSIQGPLYLRQDSHWSGYGCVVAAREIARLVRDRPWLKEQPKMDLASDWRAVEVRGDLAPAAGAQPESARLAPGAREGGSGAPGGPASAAGGTSPASRPAAEKVSIRIVGRKADGEIEPLPADRASPIVLMGDSSILVFHAGGDMHAVGAGLPDQLALELGLPVDVVAVRGAGASAATLNFARRVRADAAYLKGKRLVIWCFAAREFTESDGWRALPFAHPVAK